jgi:hypothetical protein
MKRPIFCWLCVSILISLTACGVPPTATPTPSATPSPLPTATATAPPPTQTPLPPTATLTPIPTLTYTPTPTPVPPTPVLTAPGLFAGSWSPDGRYFSFISQTSEDIANMPVSLKPGESPPGAFGFYDIQTGRSCTYPEVNPLGLNFRRGWIGWKGDHAYQVLTYTGKLVTLEAPCVDLPYALAGVFDEPVERTLAVSPDGKWALLSGEKTCWLFNAVKQTAVLLDKCSPAATFSPGGDWLALAYGEFPELHIYVYATTSGLVQKLIPWTFNGTGIDAPVGPTWVSEDRFILQPTDEGPTLVSLDREPLTEIFPGALFNVPGTFTVVAYGAPEPDNGILHMVFHLSGSGIDKSYLYHTESRILEELPYAYINWFDGNRSLLLCKYGAAWTCQSYWMRAIDPTGSQRTQAPDLAFYSLVQSPDGRLAAATSQMDANQRLTVMIRSLPGLAVIKSWADASDAYYFSWSPNSATLAAVSRPVDLTFDGGQSALYILEFK